MTPGETRLCTRPDRSSLSKSNQTLTGVTPGTARDSGFFGNGTTRKSAPAPESSSALTMRTFSISTSAVLPAGLPEPFRTNFSCFRFQSASPRLKSVSSPRTTLLNSSLRTSIPGALMLSHLPFRSTTRQAVRCAPPFAAFPRTRKASFCWAAARRSSPARAIT